MSGEGLRPIDATRADLGEGPNWDPVQNVLRFVDITRRVIYRHDPSTGTTTSIEVPQEVGAVVPRRAGGLVAAVHDGIATVDEGTGAFSLLATVEGDNSGNRMNDAKCDSRGRFWAGTMSPDAAPNAEYLYRYGPDGDLARVLEGVTISNGLGWSPDDRTMYYVDSVVGIDTFEFEAATGAVRQRQRLVTIESEVGLPDGITVDADGYIWVAIWGGGVVRRYSPSGELERGSACPCRRSPASRSAARTMRVLYIRRRAWGFPRSNSRRNRLQARASFALQGSTESRQTCSTNNDSRGIRPPVDSIFTSSHVNRRPELQRHPELEWREVPGGGFTMGGNPADEYAPEPDEAPRHRVRCTAFRIGRTPVTNQQYRSFVAATRHPAPTNWPGGAIPAGRELHPVTYVDFDDAAAFCRYVGGRLPTEAEWERAARGDDGRTWPWGEAEPHAGRARFGTTDTSPVGLHPLGESPFGAPTWPGTRGSGPQARSGPIRTRRATAARTQRQPSRAWSGAVPTATVPRDPVLVPPRDAAWEPLTTTLGSEYRTGRRVR